MIVLIVHSLSSHCVRQKLRDAEKPPDMILIAKHNWNLTQLSGAAPAWSAVCGLTPQYVDNDRNYFCCLHTTFMDLHILFSSQHLWTLMNGLRDISGLKYSSARIRNCRIHVNSSGQAGGALHSPLSSLQSWSPDSVAARTSWLALTIFAFLTFTTSLRLRHTSNNAGLQGSFFQSPDLTILRVSLDRKYHHFVVEVERFSGLHLVSDMLNPIQCIYLWFSSVAGDCIMQYLLGCFIFGRCWNANKVFAPHWLCWSDSHFSRDWDVIMVGK